MSKLLNVYTVIANGEIEGAYNDAIDAEDRVAEMHQDDLDYVTDEYGLDEDDDSYSSEAEYLAGYEGDNAYSAQFTVDLEDLDREYCTSEGDEFSGGQIIEAYRENGYNPEVNCYSD